MEVGGEGFQVVEEGLGTAMVGEFFADLVVKVALALDVGVLERIGPGPELAGAGFGRREKI
jgi:hypothetical protein